MMILKRLVANVRDSEKTMTAVGTHNEANRDTWVRRTLLALPSGTRILDAGAGEQRYREFCGHLDYVCQDFAQYEPEAMDDGLQMERWDYGALDLVCDITDIPEPDGAFGAILCTEVLEHLPAPNDALREFSRLLAPGGILIMTAPFMSLTHFAPYHFASGFNRYYYEHHFADLGLKIDELVPNGNFFELLAQELRRVPDVSRRYADDEPVRKERRAVGQVLEMLERFSNQDRGSSELACFGYQLRATKLSMSAK